MKKTDKHRIYLDNNATTFVDPKVLKEMLPYFKECCGNASSIHGFGRKARMVVEDARETVYKLIGADSSDEIIFTSGGTESDNLAIQGICKGLKKNGNHIITSAIEHKAVLNTAKLMESEGFRVTIVPVDKNGFIDLDFLSNAIKDDTILVSIMYANNETGIIQDIKKISEIVKKRNIVFHTDGVQALGKLSLKVNELGVDLVSLSAHKIYGPKGIGILYLRKGIPIVPMVKGGHQEKARRPGTENVPGIVGFASAMKLADSGFDENNEKIKSLKHRLYKGLVANVGDIQVNGPIDKTLSNTLNISFKFVEGESILLNLDMKGVACSTGSACTSGSLEPSHVLSAMKVDPVSAQGAVRFSLGKYTTKEEIDYTVSILPEIIKKLRKMSPLYEA